MSVSRIALGAALAMSLGGGSVAHAADAQGEIRLGATAAEQTVPFHVYLQLRNTAQLESFLHNVTDPTSTSYHKWLTPQQFKDAYGPTTATVAQAKSALAAAGFTVTGEHTRSLDVEGPASAVQKAFSVHLDTKQNVSTGRTREVAVENHLTMPASLAALGAQVVEFKDHINNHVHSRRIDLSAVPASRLTVAGQTQAYFANDMRTAYSFPSSQTFSKGSGLANYEQIVGLGTNIGILMSSIALPSDLGLEFNSTTTLQGGGTLTQNYSANSNL